MLPQTPRAVASCFKRNKTTHEQGRISGRHRAKALWRAARMALPKFHEFGDLPAGNHPASLAEVVARFGTGTVQRTAMTDRLRRILSVGDGDGPAGSACSLRQLCFGCG